MTYTHLTQEERYQIHNLRRQGIHLSQIAAELGRSTSTISREVRRNTTAQGYKPVLAHNKANTRQRSGNS
jgi:IS30 family transposase